MLTDEVDKKIDGAYYTFEDGRMQTGWVLTEESAAKDGSVAGYQYYGEDGKRASCWLTIVEPTAPPGRMRSFPSILRTASPATRRRACSLFSINSRSTASTPGEKCRLACRLVTREDGSTGTYYFGEDGASCAWDGRPSTTEGPGGEPGVGTLPPTASNKGMGYTGIRDGRDLRRRPAAWRPTRTCAWPL